MSTNKHRIVGFILYMALGLSLMGIPSVSTAKDHFFGMTHGFSFISEASYDADLAKMKEAGVETVKIPIHWAVIEKHRGAFDFQRTDRMIAAAVKEGIRPFGTIQTIPRWASVSAKRVDPAHLKEFSAFVTRCVQRYKNSVREWEIWNEPNNKPFWQGSAEEYVELLKVSFEAIKKEDPDAIVIGLSSGSLGFASRPDRQEFLERVLVAGGGKYFDAVSDHPHRGRAGPGQRTSKGKWAVKWTQVEEISELSSMLARFGLRKDIYLTEVGWKSAKSELLQAAFLVQMYTSMFAIPLVKQVSWFYWRNGTYRKNGYGLLREDMTPKAAYYAYVNIRNLLTGSSIVSRRESGDVVVYQFRTGTRDLWVLWTSNNKARKVDISAFIHSQHIVQRTLYPGSGSRVIDRRFALVSPHPLAIMAN